MEGGRREGEAEKGEMWDDSCFWLRGLGGWDSTTMKTRNVGLSGSKMEKRTIQGVYFFRGGWKKKVPFY